MDVDDLYGLPLERFVPERTALARGLRSAGRRDEAAAVGALRKPSVAAWAVNQLIRTQRQAMAELFKAGDILRQIQADVLDGRADAAALRAAAERERAAAETLVGAARGLLSSGGHELGQATLDRVTETLHAAALDDDARRLAGAGRLERELRHVGLGIGAGEALSASSSGRRQATRPAVAGRPAPTQAPAPTRAPAPTQAPAAGDSAAETKRLARERQEARKRAQAAERKARRDAARADGALQAAEGRRERAEEALRHAAEEVDRARADAEAATDALRQATRALRAPDVEI